MINIITDSTSDLSEELVKFFNIHVIPLLVNLDNRTFQDGVDINLELLFDLVKRTGHLPKTATPSVEDYRRQFDLPGESLFLGLSSRLSACFQIATMASEQFPPGKIRLIDSLNLSTGIGLLLLKAAEMRSSGCSIDQIEAEIRATVPKVRTSFTVDTLDYLYMGGRCTAIQNLMGSLLKIRPVLEVRPDGTVGIKDRLRGTRKKALTTMLSEFESNLPEINRRRIFVTHTGCDEDAEFLRGEIRRIASPDEVHITRAGSVVASHCGPDTIGILYLIN